MSRFGRLITAMVTPMNGDLSVDYARAAELAKRLVAGGSEGLVVCGTTGESPTLAKDEKLRLFETVVRAVGENAAVIGGTGSYNTAETVALTRRAEETGVDAVLLVAPYYNKPPQEGLYRHFRSIAESTTLPCILYNVPSRTSVNIAAQTTVRLAGDCPNIIGTKECGELTQIAEVITGAPEGFLVWSGDDAATIPMMSVGAYGVVSVVSHVAGPQMKEMIDAFAGGDVAQAAAWHRRLLPLFKGMFAVTNPVLTKAALTLTGFSPGPLRPPLLEASEAEMAELRRVLAAVDLL
jgi:4-hydroxy-tetrahydrodipicolinate synthase